MIEKASIIRQVGRFAKRQALQAAHDISQMRQCREAASSLGRKRRRFTKGGFQTFATQNTTVSYAQSGLRKSQVSQVLLLEATV
ncbi:hypothetical protein [Pseudorhodobacter aquimaris]|uniref:hypothetical protein n=1 Tax=Pseudorhodobacter aquimaris TaxID=687412 RepID=UPI0012EE07A0|nr:hypothetical protein [Pseudorhodobacter aquimaris]